jgi:anaerobic selenocysteine-containing dehydrogenase
MPSVINKPDGGKIVKTNCFDCHSKCGVLCHVDKDGVLWKVEGNPEDPRSQGRMCPKGRAATKILYDEHRNNYPLRRVGKRGEGKWKRISWEEALDEIAERVERYRKEVGPESIVFGQGTGRGVIPWIQRLGVANGVNHWCSPAHACLLPQMLTQMILIGMFSVWDGADHDDSQCIVSWGANMVWTEGAFIAGEINRSRDRAAKLIVIDPCFEHPLASRADHFLGVRPGSDLALAMAWIRIIIHENLYDADFIKRWTTLPLLIDAVKETPITEDMLVAGGDAHTLLVWDNISQSVKNLADTAKRELGLDPALDFSPRELMGADGERIQVKTAWEALKSRVEDMTPEHAAGICWLEAEDIIAACRTYATTKPASIAMMQGIEEHTNARMAIHAITVLIALTGNIDIRGGNAWHQFWNDMLSPKLTGEVGEYHATHKLGGGEDGAFYPNSTGKGVWNAILTGEPYRVKAFIGIQGNPVAWCENPDRTVEALKAVDFLVINDYYLSSAAQFADIVLPAAHWTERDFLADEFCQEWHYAQQKAVEPLYERKSDVSLCREIGKRINPEAWPWETDDEMFDFALELHNITYAELKENWVMQLYPYRPKKYEEKGFATHTGKAELYSFAFLSQGRCEPLFHWEEPAESPFAVSPEIACEYPFILSTGRRYVNYYHSAYRGVPLLRELAPEPHIMINPEAAAKLAIVEGDWVYLESPYGTRKIKMRAHITHGVHPRVIIAPHGWWQGCPELGLPDYPNNEANINCLISDQSYDRDLGCPGMRSSLCRVTKAQGRGHVNRQA